jgi:hypothetical protein
MASGSLGCKILVKSLTRPFGPRGVDLSTIKPLTLIRIRKEFVGPRGLFETLFRLLVSGMEVRMQLLARRRYAFRMSSGEAAREIPRISYGSFTA